MSTNSQTQATSDPVADPAASLFSFWTQWMEQSARGTQAMLEAMQSAGDPQQMQRQWLDAVARSIEDFMRTPVFQEAMKRNLKMVTDLKRLQDQVLQDTARQLGKPMATDITGLFDRLQSTEQTIVNRLQTIEDRLKAVEDKLNSSSGHRRSSNRAADEAVQA
jgi:predicted component of type VI protein secretion system